MRPRSLSGRLIISSAIVSIILLAAAGVLLAGLFTAALERNFDARLRAVLDGLLANVEVDKSGNPQLPSQLADPRFDLPVRPLLMGEPFAETLEPRGESGLFG